MIDSIEALENSCHWIVTINETNGYLQVLDRPGLKQEFELAGTNKLINVTLLDGTEAIVRASTIRMLAYTTPETRARFMLIRLADQALQRKLQEQAMAFLSGKDENEDAAKQAPADSASVPSGPQPVE